MGWMKTVVVLGCLGAAQVEAAPVCDELWGQTCYGMTVNQVLKAVPGASAHAALAGKNLANGAFELATGPDQTIAGEMFTPRYYFLNGRLDEVMLTLEGVTDSYKATSAFEALTDALRAKYGPELSLHQTLIGRDGNWRHGKTNIALALFVIGNADPHPLLNVVYQTRLAEDAGHL